MDKATQYYDGLFVFSSAFLSLLKIHSFLRTSDEQVIENDTIIECSTFQFLYSSDVFGNLIREISIKI